MKTLFIDCGMGAAGDMLTAALLELLPDPDGFVEKLNNVGIPDVVFKKERVEKNGITGTQVSVQVHGEEESSEMFDAHDHQYDHESEQDSDPDHHHDHHHFHMYAHSDEHVHIHTHVHEHGGHQHSHAHSGLADIAHIVNEHLDLPDKVRTDVMNIYGMIAEAESHVHGVPVTDIHFHEVGTMDAVVDITAVCMLMYELAPDEVIASPVHVGSGQVKCAHVILPVPAPATAFILRGVPIYGGSVDGELCTPTGAALLKYFVTRFGEMPVMETEAIGYGMGKKNFTKLNCVRVMIGETSGRTDVACELSCNVDDMTAEEIGFAMECLFKGGAHEVYTIPIGMKKNRPGTLLSVICSPEDKDQMVQLLYKNTTTIGIRIRYYDRCILDREITTLQTPYGEVRVKSSSGYGVSRKKYEFDDIARIAREQNIGFRTAQDLVRKSDQ